MGGAVFEIVGDEKLGGCAVIPTLANLRAIYPDALLGTTALGVEEHIPVAPYEWQIHFVELYNLAILVCGGGGEAIE